MIDRNALLEDLDIEAYTDYLGIEKKRHGTRTFIRCPGHLKRLGKADRNISNAVLTRQGYYCFSCGEYHNAIDMTEEVDNCGFKDAVGKISTFLGRSYSEKSTVKPVKCPISKEDLKLLGIGIGRNKSRAYTGYGNESGEKVGYNTYLKYESVYCSIDSLYRDDYEAFAYMISEKAMEARRKISFLLDLFSPDNSDSDGFADKIGSYTNPNDFKTSLCKIYTEYLERIDNIILSIRLQSAA